jgi:glycosyltransferase involved in cell wall biosynthesis
VSKLKVAIWMVSYNHKDYIVQAVESVMMQKTDFDFKLFIGEDCSTDNTRELCIKLQEKYPDKIELVLHKNNLGPNKNAIQIYNKCYESGAKYIALLEGDDYWTDSSKLNRQVAFLENNQDFVLVGHNAFLNRNGKEENKLVRNSKLDYKDYTTSYLIKNNPFVTCGVMFLNIDLKEIFPFFEIFTAGDKVLFTYLSFKGKCRFYSSPIGFYRKHENSLSSKNRIDYKPFRDDLINRINHAEFWNNFSNNKFGKEAKEVLEYRSKVLTGMALWNLDFKTAIYYSQFVNLKDVKKIRSRIIIRLLKVLS